MESEREVGGGSRKENPRKMVEEREAQRKGERNKSGGALMERNVGKGREEE